jgi:hypothetical protein
VTAVAGAEPVRVPARMHPAWVVGACVAVSVLSLAVPTALAFDPWAWLVWGREVAGFDLDTTGGPSWKPLPVLFTTVLAPFGDLAPTLWLVFARTVGLLGVVLTYRLAARFAGAAAGVLAAGALLLTPDGGPRFLRLLLEGHSATTEVFLTLWAVESHLDGHRRRTLLIGLAMALLRPEAWPFVGLYGLWLWAREPRWRPLLVGCGLVVPLLWFGGDWWGSGSPWQGAGAAQVIEDPAWERLTRALDHVAKSVVAPVWIAAGVAVVSAWRRGERALLWMAGGALAWNTLVVVMSVGLKYAALSRFLLPSAALLCVLAGIGAVRAARAARGHAGRTAAIVLVVLLSVPLVGTRLLAFDALFADIGDRARSEEQLLEAIDDAGGAEVVAGRCDQVAVERSSLPQAVLTWQLELALAEVRRAPVAGSHVEVVRRGGELHRRLDEVDPTRVDELGGSEDWVVVTIDCPAPGP